MRTIKKGVKLHVAAKQFEFFEVWSENSVELNSDATEETVRQESAKLFEEQKEEVLKDTFSLLEKLNLPPSDNIVSRVKQATVADPVQTDNIDVLADIEDILNEVNEKKTYKSKAEDEISDKGENSTQADFGDDFPQFL